MTVDQKTYLTPEAQFERRYGMLVFHGNVADFDTAPDTDSSDGWMARIYEPSLLTDDAVYAFGSLESFVRVQGMGSTVIRKTAISEEVNAIALSRSAGRLTTRK